MIHSLLLLGDKLTLLFARYFDGSSDAQQAKTEGEVADALRLEWVRVMTSGAAGTTIAVELEDKVVVCRHVGTVTPIAMVLTGSDEHDELALSEILDVLEGIVADSAGEGKKLSEESVYSGYGKLSVCVDDLIVDGHVYTTDLATVLKLSKHKALPAPKK